MAFAFVYYLEMWDVRGSSACKISRRELGVSVYQQN